MIEIYPHFKAQPVDSFEPWGLGLEP